MLKGSCLRLQVSLQVIDLQDAPFGAVQSLIRDTTIALASMGQCQCTARYKGLTVKDKQLCLVLKQYDKNLAEAHQLAGGAPAHDDLINISNGEHQHAQELSIAYCVHSRACAISHPLAAAGCDGTF